MALKASRIRLLLGPGITLGLAALLAVVVAQLPEGSGARAQPVSDGFAVTPTVALPPTNVQSTADVATEAGESLRGGIASTVWRQSTPCRAMSLGADAREREHDTVSDIDAGPRVDSLALADCNDNRFGLQSGIVLGATGGNVYDSQVGSSLSDLGDHGSNLADGASLGSISGTVTGDDHLLALGTYEGVSIITPVRFVALLASQHL